MAVKNKQGDLLARNKYAFAYLELAKDKNFCRLPHKKQVGLINEAMKLGEDVADWAILEYKTDDPRKIAEDIGLRVFGEDKGIVGKVIKHSEYRPESKEIVIFRDSLQRMMREIDETELNKRLLRYLVAHELFHHLERTKFGEVYNKFKLTMWKFGPFSKQIYIRRLSEVAAQAFTQKLLGLEFSPRVFDYLMYVLYTSKS